MGIEIKVLKNYFQERPEVIMAFLFGSFSKGWGSEESDVDIAVYLKEDGKQIDDIWSEVITIVEREVDLVNLEKVPATLASNILKTGLPLSVKDKNLYWRFYLEKSLEAEDFYYFLKDFWRIYQKSKSLIPEEEARLLERLQFLKSELEEIEELKDLSFKDYQEDKVKRRNIERWAENILNATIDMAKIVLASERRKMPKTYEQALFDFVFFIGIEEKEAKTFSHFSTLRNILAHEYLDILYHRIQDFISRSPDFYQKIFAFLEKYLERGEGEFR